MSETKSTGIYVKLVLEDSLLDITEETNLRTQGSHAFPPTTGTKTQEGSEKTLYSGVCEEV